ncbi:hypothetical protein EMIT0194MI4_20422 [Pseudomonas sp. IT-194MI4]
MQMTIHLTHLNEYIQNIRSATVAVKPIVAHREVLCNSSIFQLQESRFHEHVIQCRS